ncbi:HEATR2 [Bugula neritina]|uniref:HEATR2 n=1 Tax=Bugula neritina TaxID=10212 RepID=A0A7J7JFL1_BUGNE|nr:HEATR2 [Bugula neritina]
MEAIYKATIDEEPVVVNYVEKTCELLGYFISPDVWVPVVTSTIKKYQHFGSILALANLIKGSEECKLRDFLPSICSLMSSADVCTSRLQNVQDKTLDCVKAVLNLYSLGVLEPIPVSYDLFKTVISVISVKTSETVEAKGKATLKELSEVQGLEYDDLFKQHALQLLESFGDSYLHWTKGSVERHMFDVLLVNSGPVVGELLDKIIPMITANMKSDKDIEVKSKLFSLVSGLIQNSADTINSLIGVTLDIFGSHLYSTQVRFGDFAVILVKDMILPNCIWKAGQTAAAFRTLAVSCLWSLLKHKLLTAEQLLSVTEELLTQMLTLLEDDRLNTRLVTCRVIMHMLSVVGKEMDRHRLYNIYPNLLKRLDDSNDNVRIAVSKTLEAYFKSFNEQYDAKSYRAHFEELVKGLFLHLDDSNTEVQEAVQGIVTFLLSSKRSQ